MRKLLIILTSINIVLAMLQTSFFLELFGPILNPNLVFAFAFSVALVAGEKSGRISALIGGLLLDLMGVLTVGLSSLTFVVLLSLSYLVRRVVPESWLLNLLFVLFAHILYLLVINSFHTRVLSTQVFVGAAFTTFFYFVFYLLNNLLIFKLISQPHIKLKFKDM